MRFKQSLGNYTVKVTVLIAPMCSSTSVAATLEMLEAANVLNAANSQSKDKIFHLETVSLDGKPVQCSGGLTLTPQTSIEMVKQSDLIIVPGFLFSILQLLPTLKAFIPWLQHHFQNQTTICASCTGVFMLAEAGILNSTLATTHWFYADEFKQRYPEVKLQENHTVTEDNNIICSGGGTAGNDLLLHVIRKFGSSELTAECAKKLLVDLSPRKQSPYIQLAFNKNHKDTDILEVQQWLEKHFSEEVNMDTLANQFGFGLRNFTRRFKESTNLSPIHYLQSLRLEETKRLLESTKNSFDVITYQVGYEDSNSFRRLFKARVGISPGGYRKKFTQA